MIPVGTYMADGRSRSLNAARLVNHYPEFPVPDSRSPVVLRSTPGLSTFSTIGPGPIRGIHVMASVPFTVSGTDLYSISSAGAGTLRGAAGTITGTGFVSMASNQNGELVIVNASGIGWRWNGATLARLSVLDADFTDDATNVTFLDQYVLYGKRGTGRVYASDLNNASSWSALSFATAEAQDDNVIWVYGFAGNLWVFGDSTVEVWYNAGTSPFPFARLPGAVFEVGGIANTVADVQDVIYWLASNGSVYRAAGLVPERISTNEIDYRIKDWTDRYAFAYQQEGHSFYVLGGAQGAVCYDASTALWHERNSFALGRWRANSHGTAYGKDLVGDYNIGRIYDMALSNHADGAQPLQRRIVSPPLEDAGRLVTFSDLQIHFEHGKGLTSGQGSDPQVILDWSDDGGHNWSNEHWGAIGKIGEYRRRAIWRRLGSARYRLFRLTYSDPTPYTVYGADLS